MPFTFSHPAIVLPLGKISPRYVSLTGLVVGSISPDFEYFIRFELNSQFSHTFGGIFYFCLPFSLFLAYIFHNWVRDPLLTNLPKSLRRRLIRFKAYDWRLRLRKNFGVVALSIIVGALSHVVWDDFTHGKGYFVQRFSFLQTTYGFAEMQYPLYRFLQHLSSVLGLIAIAVTVFRLPKTKASKHGIGAYWMVLLSIFIICVVIRFFIINGFSLSPHLIVEMMSLGLISVMIHSIIWKLIGKIPSESADNA